MNFPIVNFAERRRLHLHRLLSIVLAFLILLSSQHAEAAKRVALVVGNAAYKHAPELENPRNDAEDMAAKLETMGFEVVRGTDLTMGQTRAAVRNFIIKLTDADMALFYYAGHGVQVNGENYLAPIDAKLTSYDFLEFETLSVETVIRAMERNVKTNLVVLDACRDNPLAQNLARSMGTRSGGVGRGLAKVGSGIGTLIAFSTQPGNVALDGRGRNSPYTAALLKHLGTPGADITRDLVKVRNEVLATTSGKQVPWENSSLTGEVVLVPKLNQATPVAKARPQSGAAGNVAMELAYWDSIKTAKTAAYYQAYLAKWPNGVFASIARIRIEDLRRKSELLAKTQASQRQVDKSLGSEAAPTGSDKQEPRASGQSDGKQIAGLQPVKNVEQTESVSDPAKDKQLLRNIQIELNRVGCSVGRADGKWGQASARGLTNFAKHEKVKLSSLNPSPDLLNILKQEKARVCPLVCGRRHIARGNKCILKACGTGQRLNSSGNCVAKVKQPSARTRAKKKTAKARSSKKPDASKTQCGFCTPHIAWTGNYKKECGERYHRMRAKDLCE